MRELWIGERRESVSKRDDERKGESEHKREEVSGHD